MGTSRCQSTKDRVFYDQCPRQYQPASSKWRDNRRVRFQIPPSVRPWLLDEASLTEHLMRCSGGAFRVQLQLQYWGLPDHSERDALGLAPRQVALMRETLLLVREQAWVYARSVIPASTLSGSNRRLRSLGNRSLGSWLFHAPDMQRAPFEVALLQPGHSPVPAEFQRDFPLWGRRSRFEVHGAPLLVCEIFLPDFVPWPTIGAS